MSLSEAPKEVWSKLGERNMALLYKRTSRDFIMFVFLVDIAAALWSWFYVGTQLWLWRRPGKNSDVNIDNCNDESTFWLAYPRSLG